MTEFPHGAANFGRLCPIAARTETVVGQPAESMVIDHEAEPLVDERGASETAPRTEHTETHVGDPARGIRNGVLLGALIWAVVLAAIFLL